MLCIFFRSNLTLASVCIAKTRYLSKLMNGTVGCYINIQFEFRYDDYAICHLTINLAHTYWNTTDRIDIMSNMQRWYRINYPWILGSDASVAWHPRTCVTKIHFQLASKRPPLTNFWQLYESCYEYKRCAIVFARFISE